LAVAGPPGWGDADAGLLAGVPGPVVRLGFVDPGDLPTLHRGAVATVVPSLAEGFGLPVLEALAAGAAVVTTSGTACGEVAGDAALLVPPGDAEALASALGRLLDDAEVRERLRAAAPARAAAFHWGDTAAAVLEVYRRVLGER
jgi:glycosyltransferase involved in cell wall biosynthesis